METYKERAAMYERRAQMATWLGASLAGFVALMAAGAVPEEPSFLLAGVSSLIALAALCAGFARVGFEWEATLIRRDAPNETALLKPLKEEDQTWPRCERWWMAFLVFYWLSGLAFFVSVWWKPVSNLVQWLSCGPGA